MHRWNHSAIWHISFTQNLVEKTKCNIFTQHFTKSFFQTLNVLVESVSSFGPFYASNCSPCQHNLWFQDVEGLYMGVEAKCTMKVFPNYVNLKPSFQVIFESLCKAFLLMVLKYFPSPRTWWYQRSGTENTATATFQYWISSRERLTQHR